MIDKRPRKRLCSWQRKDSWLRSSTSAGKSGPTTVIRCTRARPTVFAASAASERPPQWGKTNPSEPIDCKQHCFNEMQHILIKRTHWNHLAYFEVLTAIFGPISANCVPSRTRIRGWSPDVCLSRASSARSQPMVTRKVFQNKAGMSFRINANFTASPL